ncbi:MAG: lactate permease LctP family transporter [Gemmataceae bacterium]
MTAWTQLYDPLGSPWLSTLLAALPTVLLLGLLASGRVSAAGAAFWGLLAALTVAIVAYRPLGESGAGPADYDDWAPTMLAAALNGAAFGLMPIGWIVLSAIFLYHLTVHSGTFEIVKRSVASLSGDRRIQALLIAFSFGAFIEGAAGFGTPVAISAALMMGAGFRPLYAAGLALLANTSPVAFGALGTPILTLANVTKIDETTLSAMAGRQLPLFSLIVPAWLVWVMAGWRGVVGVWPALVVCGGSFALVQFLTANFHGPWLVDVAGGLISLVSLAIFLRFWQPRETWKFPDEREPERQDSSTASPIPGAAKAGHSGSESSYSPAQLVHAWIPWLLLTILVFLWGLPQVKSSLGAPTAKVRADFKNSDDQIQVHPGLIMVRVPHLDARIARDRPVVKSREIESAFYEFNWLSATGTSIFLAAILSALWLRVSLLDFFLVLRKTLRAMCVPLFTIACMLAIAFTTRFSGMDATLGLAFTQTGYLYPMFAALLGWLGVALTGSDTSSNALFGSLQVITAGQLVQGGYLPLSEAKAGILLASANSTGGVMGKMIDAQSIVVAAVATEQHGQEAPILRFVFWHSILLALLMGVLVLLQAYVFSWMIP